MRRAPAEQELLHQVRGAARRMGLARPRENKLERLLEELREESAPAEDFEQLDEAGCIRKVPVRYG
jgi:hypothetical protein